MEGVFVVLCKQENWFFGVFNFKYREIYKVIVSFHLISIAYKIGNCQFYNMYLLSA